MLEQEKERLIDAAKKGDKEAIQKAFWEAARYNDIDDTLSFLLKTKEIKALIDINQPEGKWGTTPFMAATAIHAFASAQILFHFGADPYVSGTNKRSAIT